MIEFADDAARTEPTTAIIINDLHVPYHDRRVIDLVLEFTSRFKPDQFVINGDLLDMFKVSRFDKDPMRGASLIDEFRIGREILAACADAAPDAERHYVFGNHEYRFDVYLWQQAKELQGVEGLSIEEQLHCKEHGFQTHYRKGRESVYYVTDNLTIGHWNIARKHSGYTAKGVMDKHHRNSVQGHTHRIGSHYLTENGVVWQAHENGCLCALDPDYVLEPNWQHAFAIARWDASGWCDVETVPIIGYRCRYF